MEHSDQEYFELHDKNYFINYCINITESFEGLECGGHYVNFRCFDSGKDISNDYLGSRTVLTLSEEYLNEIKHNINLNMLDNSEIINLRD